jgi:hypothetical protein
MIEFKVGDRFYNNIKPLHVYTEILEIDGDNIKTLFVHEWIGDSTKNIYKYIDYTRDIIEEALNKKVILKICI